ncbi:MAG TPA: phage tail protein, partial [Sphingomonas sp.]|nr:phage tail protein [Sphingomonas sp.]
MATLVLGAVGTLVGGPIGGAIGAVIGNQVDRALFSPRAAKGARLGSLAVQQSRYGSELPRLFGRMRIAGTVIWATDLKEDVHHSGGKGRPKTTSYSYSASFAVALSGRAIRSVGRIWADGNLLRGEAGDWKSELGAFRLYLGDEAQEPDPLIASAEGIGATPAHRGVAYAVFEDLQLGDFGNRIPSLSFEVTADPGPVAIGAIAAALSDGAIRGEGGPSLVGYAAGGDSVRGAIEGLGHALPVVFADTGEGLALVDEAAPPIAIDAGELGAAEAGKAARLTIDRQAAGTLNEAIAVAYYDPALDYQQGLQTARREASARRAGAIELPAAVEAPSAKAIAEARLAREWAARAGASLSLPWRRLGIGAGALLTLPGETGTWRVTRRRFEAMVATLDAVRLPPAGAKIAAADPGLGVSEPDLPQGPTTLSLLDLPALGDDPANAPTLLIAAAGASAGWRRASLLGSLNGGASWKPIGTTAPAAVRGTAVTALPAADPWLADEASTVEVELLNDNMALADEATLGVSATANLALIGDEIVQFGSAEPIAPKRWRLSRLLRGRRGTEWAIEGHGPSERFVLLDPATLAGCTLPASAIGAPVMVAASGIGDAEPA